MKETQLIQYALIKLSKTGGLYAKATERWQGKDVNDRKVCGQISANSLWHHNMMLAENSGTTMHQEGCGGALMQPMMMTMARSRGRRCLHREWATEAESKVTVKAQISYGSFGGGLIPGTRHQLNAHAHAPGSSTIFLDATASAGIIFHTTSKGQISKPPGSQDRKRRNNYKVIAKCRQK